MDVTEHPLSLHHRSLPILSDACVPFACTQHNMLRTLGNLHLSLSVLGWSPPSLLLSLPCFPRPCPPRPATFTRKLFARLCCCFQDLCVCVIVRGVIVRVYKEVLEYFTCIYVNRCWNTHSLSLSLSLSLSHTHTHTHTCTHTEM